MFELKTDTKQQDYAGRILALILIFLEVVDHFRLMS